MLRIGRSSARASAKAKAKSKSEAREFGEEGWPVGAVLWGAKDGPNFGVGMCSEIWLRWEGPPLYEPKTSARRGRRLCVKACVSKTHDQQIVLVGYHSRVTIMNVYSFIILER